MQNLMLPNVKIFSKILKRKFSIQPELVITPLFYFLFIYFLSYKNIYKIK